MQNRCSATPDGRLRPCRHVPPSSQHLPRRVSRNACLQVPHGHRSYAKRQGLTYVRGYAMEAAPIMLTSEFPDPLLKPEAAQQLDAAHTGAGSASHIPQWVANDRKVCMIVKRALPQQPTLT